jgi:ribosomal protein S13
MYFIDTELNNNKTIFSSLTNIFGINFSTSKKICKYLGFSKYMIVKDLSKGQIRSLLNIISKLKIKTSHDLKKRLVLKKKKSYKYQIL